MQIELVYGIRSVKVTIITDYPPALKFFHIIRLAIYSSVTGVFSFLTGFYLNVS